MKPTLRSLVWVVPVAAVALWCLVDIQRPRPEFLLQRVKISEIVQSVAPVEVRPPGWISIGGAETSQTSKGSLDHGFFETRLILANPQEANYGARVCSAVEEAMAKAGAKVQGKGGGGDSAFCTLTYRHDNRHGKLDVIVVPDSGSWRHVLVIATEI